MEGNCDVHSALEDPDATRRLSSDEEDGDIQSQYARLLTASTDALTYDPDQSFEQRANIRATYSLLLKTIKDEKRRIASQPVGSSHSVSLSEDTSMSSSSDCAEEGNVPNSLRGLIEKANQVLSSSIRNIHDATFDSHLLKLSAEAGLASLEKLEVCSNDNKSPLSIGLLIEHLDSLITSTDSLSLFGLKCQIASKSAPFIDFANGPITVPASTPLPSSRRTRTAQKPLSSLTQPDTLVLRMCGIIFRTIPSKPEEN
ncbi:hypothetical protein DI09_137p90 [Mitosporidium daphniae]|uniref:Non-structural maintenance of chromosomes element 4 n=1 Tax=Mitosporidium daphniae TaxID=1485682 RepID=A0A098VV87_9MICR|nr:uncharacterized protein DI09_137p90 [Mitosporidium daphniae]KGG52774.1 hypothetical protein DI09_137p90 [Mitosporidium daphniae]|eukprot:XP_013239210.1 uncharacterized protein DI09_137p90 [Mitosporidium daphniae]